MLYKHLRLFILLVLRLLFLPTTSSSFVAFIGNNISYKNRYSNNRIGQFLTKTTKTTSTVSVLQKASTTTRTCHISNLDRIRISTSFNDNNNKYKREHIVLHDTKASKEEGEGGETTENFVFRKYLRNKLTTMFAGRENWKIHIGLFVFYWLILGKIVFPRLIFPSNTHTEFWRNAIAVSTMKIIFGTMWLTFVLAISGMEAWLKFRAPFCPRGFALDIGRTIFPALNIVELALCGVCWHYDSTFSPRNKPLFFDGLRISTFVLLIDIIWLTPKLVTRGKQVVYQHILKERKKNNGSSSTSSLDYINDDKFKLLEAEMKTQKFEKKDKWHVVYVVLELIKMIALGQFIVTAAWNIM